MFPCRTVPAGGLLLLFSWTLVVPARGEVRLPGIFGDAMVLQQQRPIKVWGWADPGESITVSIAAESQTTTADDQGRWRLELPPRPASSEPLRLTVRGENQIDFNDVLVGEVWLCSGQSNMEWPVERSSDAKREIAAADHPMIRHIKFPRRPSMQPLDEISGEWQICSPDTVASFTAVGYFMARRLQQQLNVPIGLINASWGGTRVEPWTPPVGFEQTPALRDIHDSLQARLAGTEPPYQSHQDPTMLYNGMIHAFVGFPIRGAIWYQGESNHLEGMLYYEKKKALINGWRQLWGQGDFPFYFVQIAPFQYGDEDPQILPRFWEAQAAVTELNRTGMVVINDIATVDDIHPPNKQDVGWRLANMALHHDYGHEELVADHPKFENMEVVGQTLHVHFANTGGGLKTRDDQPPTHFEVIGQEATEFQPANARIDGDKVILSAPGVTQPVGFRFAWHKLAEPNLMGGTGLPVAAVRGGVVGADAATESDKPLR